MSQSKLSIRSMRLLILGRGEKQSKNVLNAEKWFLKKIMKLTSKAANFLNCPQTPVS
jgi:hypothetical protein